MKREVQRARVCLVALAGDDRGVCVVGNPMANNRTVPGGRREKEIGVGIVAL